MSSSSPARDHDAESCAPSQPRLCPSSIGALRSIARRYAASPDEADDLVQDMLLAALEQRRAWNGATLGAWANGVLRRRALHLARTEGRRRRREALYATELPAPGASLPRLPRRFIEELPPSLRVVALLTRVGLGRAEIGSVLGITDTALRQRISSLRRAWLNSGCTADVVDPGPANVLRSEARRRYLKAGLVRASGARFAIDDPDGHPVFFGAAHKSAAAGNE